GSGAELEPLAPRTGPLATQSRPGPRGLRPTFTPDAADLGSFDIVRRFSAGRTPDGLAFAP
ncbi:MAG: hypothetical protein AAFQ43_09940, partial [Bacteroidota bacterium]